jgi:pyruvate,orthophosphate dikinase
MEAPFKELTTTPSLTLTGKKVKYVFSFKEGDGKNKKLLGGKGANLCEMTQIGLNVPPGFVISTEACMSYLQTNKQLPNTLMEEVLHHMEEVEAATGKFFGDAENPLLVSVRSGSALSMPGMMDTILNLGLNALGMMPTGVSFNCSVRLL